MLDPRHWQPVLEVVRQKLLTPVGLRSLAPGHPAYQAHYDGNLRMRDAAYHQGTVWTWLLGPFVDAWLKVNPEDRAGAPRVSGGVGAAPERGGRRVDQRDFRRREAVHAARLHRAGVERRGGAALLGEDGVKAAGVASVSQGNPEPFSLRRETEHGATTRSASRRG